MADQMNAELWLNEATGGRRFAAALGVAVLIELGAFGLLLPYMANRPPPPAEQQSVVKLSVVAPAPPAPPAPPPPKPVPPHKPVTPSTPPPPMPVTPPLPMPPPPPMPVAHRAIVHKPPPRHITPPPVTPPVFQQPPLPTPPPPAAAPAAPSAGELELFQSKMREAVQAAAITPSAAELAHEAGVTRVSFTFQDGVVSNIIVVASCGFPLLDDAAIQAVREARYPQEPPDLAGRPHQVLVDVIFRAAATSVDSD